ncbi:hypothetical protein [Caballeronia fortuita]|uniref:hypothetical protein n=1 Tax=Caballeronia fortuita TaxID=1777138 RepID=UPI0012FD021B|nr:hypothetical protein [Caballeronia fortuita]
MRGIFREAESELRRFRIVIQTSQRARGILMMRPMKRTLIPACVFILINAYNQRNIGHKLPKWKNLRRVESKRAASEIIFFFAHFA